MDRIVTIAYKLWTSIVGDGDEFLFLFLLVAATDDERSSIIFENTHRTDDETVMRIARIAVDKVKENFFLLKALRAAPPVRSSKPV